MAPAHKKQRLSNGSAVALDHVEEAPAGDNSTNSSPTKKPDQQKRSLFVRSLPEDTTTESLTTLFSESYPVKHATAILDPATKKCRGYGFVTFADAEDALRAKKEFNGHVIDGKKLRVEVAEPRKRDGEGAGKDKPEKEQEQAPLPPKLIVRNLPWSIKGSEQLTKLFMSYGKVKQAYVPKKGPGLMAGFGFVIMRGRKNAEKAIEGINGKEVDGRTLAVDWAVEKAVYEDLQEKDESAANPEGVNAEEEDAHDDSEPDADDGEGVELSAGSDDEVDEDGEDEDDEDDDEDDEGIENDDLEEDEDDEDDDSKNKTEDKSLTMFVRNLPFTCTDEDLEDHFSQFGSVRYARVVMDHNTERSRGTGFVCFYNKEDADNCLRNAPRRQIPTGANAIKSSTSNQPTHSILQNDNADPSGQYTLDGRVLQVTAAVPKNEASRLADEGTAHRTKRDNDKRRLYLLSEGTISSKSKLYEKLSPSEKAMRESSAKQRKSMIETNPSLHLSLTRLAVRNIPRSIGSKELKALARDAVVGFASDVKSGVREKLSKEELARGSEEMQAAEAARKRAGKGIVKQATVVFEGASGTKVGEDSGAGRSRGYGFIEYHTHRNALMGLRWLNGHAVGYQVTESKKRVTKEDVEDRKKRLIVEFAIENAQVVLRRKEKEEKARTRSKTFKEMSAEEKSAFKKGGPDGKDSTRKRKRGQDGKPEEPAGEENEKSKKGADEKLARRNQIIGRKRAVRKARKGGK